MRGVFRGEIEGTLDDALYRTERWFPPRRALEPAYRIPLPPGRYRISLHFAEIWLRPPDRRVFDVSIEGRQVLERFEPGQAGFATASSPVFEVEVSDGMLDIEFVAHQENPKISAIEIEG